MSMRIVFLLILCFCFLREVLKMFALVPCALWALDVQCWCPIYALERVIWSTWIVAKFCHYDSNIRGLLTWPIWQLPLRTSQNWSIRHKMWIFTYHFIETRVIHVKWDVWEYNFFPRGPTTLGCKHVCHIGVSKKWERNFIRVVVT